MNEIDVVLSTLASELERREHFWRNQKDDPHQIGTALMVACAEVKESVQATITALAMVRRGKAGKKEAR